MLEIFYLFCFTVELARDWIAKMIVNDLLCIGTMAVPDCLSIVTMTTTEC